MINNLKVRFLTFTLIPTITTLGLQSPAFSGETPKNQKGASEAGELIICPEPRPQACRRDYSPVCAEMMDGSHKTYPNACTSCTNADVVGYRDGSCDGTK